MSANNGDRSRHNRLRKAKERRRMISRATRAEQAAKAAVKSQSSSA
jgi:hypothetical protein